MPTFRFPNGAATPTGAYVIVHVIDDAGRQVPGNLYADYRFASGTEGFGTDWTAISLCYHPSENAVYAAGENGEIVRITEGGNAQEFIVPDDNGPTQLGPIREIRSVGNSLFAVGMGRQVYRRTDDRRWQRFDIGVLDLSDHLTSGFTSISSNGPDRLVAVGYDGDIWEYQNGWIQVDSPTNILLTRITPHKGTLYAGGVLGTLLCRSEAGWGVIDTGEFTRDIWGLASFAGRLFLGTAEGLFWMAPGGVINPVDPATFTRQVQCTALSAWSERLWCFGGTVVSSTGDGINWREEPVL